MNNAKKALWMGVCGVVLGGAAFLAGKLIREKKLEEELWEVDEDSDAEIEFSMFAGDVDVEEEDPCDDVCEEMAEELPEVEVVNVVLTGPRTARVRPTEEEEKEMLREKLEQMIRF